MKIPITGTNWSKPGHGLTKAHMDEEGYINFRIGNEYNPACYYLIVKE